MERACLNCNEKIEGRIDKIYCSTYCKSSYHYKIKKKKTVTRFKEVNEQLKINRSILKHFHTTGKTIMRKEELFKKGFNPNFFTNYWKNSKNDIYLFCYEYGYLSLKEANKEKYLLINWQPYMQ
ncbi:hypothetical protein [Pseudofulvibacter geojedonensis]|uniref:DUF2116 family Zn-ribbon domain-containing protein n=1 Tax=Pseudofulvibacter geojedonensis TaxID=1123758 RepID=A0ABW3HXU7_9FLAO